MRTATTLRRACWAGLAILSINAGCTHNYYYGGTPVCPPVGQTVTTQLGQVCDVSGGGVITSSAAPAVVSQSSGGTPIATPESQRVVISQPTYNPALSNRLRWRRPNPEESLATTRYEGGLAEPTVNK